MVARTGSRLRRHGRSLVTALAAVGALATALPALGDAALTTVSLPEGTTPIGIAKGPGGVWFTDPPNGVVGRIGANDEVTTWPVNELDAMPTAIHEGPDGAVWFTEPGINAIGQITTDGVVTDVPMSVTGSSPSAVAAGPDGNLWYALRSANKIGWGTLTGGFQELTLAGTPGPSWLAAGPGGTMWFTGGRSDVIGKIDVATKGVTTFELAIGSTPNSIVQGADGAMWFTLRGSNQLGRITSAGGVTLLDIGGGVNANPNGIAAGADGSIWFAMTALDRVARFAEGSLDTYAVGGSPRAVAVDSAGDAWVTEAGPGTITRIHVDSTPPDTTAPVITIDAPAVGDWVVAGTDGLAADYGCVDETALASCDGDVADGDPVEDGTLGVRTFAVHAEDAAGNGVDATATYMVFASAEGSLFDGGAVRPGSWLTLSLGMDLAHRADDPLAGASTQLVDCTTGDALGGHEAAVVRTRVGPHGTLELRWDTDRSWSGCRTLWLSFAPDGWRGAEARFGQVRFV